MSGIQCDGYYVLMVPTVVPADGDSPMYHTYLSSPKLDAGRLAISIALPIHEPDNAQLLPPGTVAHVTGSLVYVQNAVFITASTVMGVHLASTPTLRAEYPRLFQPYISFHGTVINKVVDINRPTVKIVDVSVPCIDRWPRMPLDVRCFFDRDEKRFHALYPFEPRVALEVSGVVTGWDDGKLAVDVHHVCCGNGGDVPEEPLVAYPGPYENREISHGFAVFSNPSTLPQCASLPIYSQLSRFPPGVAGSV